ncbi:MAG: bifunctional 2-polyprenyl-6-hydroxyphenol methylase/3-demethylubiquinol 3-O-methyltransferase UbiG [Pseudomonadota bacterium]
MQSPVDNQVYRRRGHAWWDEDEGEFSSLRFFVNHVRFAFFRRILEQEGTWGLPGTKILDVGCGGGFLSEEFARNGFSVRGVDPAPESVAAARSHAREAGLAIEYLVAAGENLPFDDQSFDLAACCDVLEHVNDVGRVIGEISRVLKPGGLFVYDTVNRTFLSRIAVIKVMQEWPSTAFAGPNSHVWEKFIKPRELAELFRQNDLVNLETRGLSLGINPLAAWLYFRRRGRGEISFRELGRRLRFRESGDLRVSYMGCAVKPARRDL